MERAVGYLECPRCAGSQLFVLYEGHDENMAECSGDGCGYQFGYFESREMVTDPTTGATVVGTVVRPQLDPAVLSASMAAYQGGVRDRLMARYGGLDVARARIRLAQGLAEEDPAKRAALLNSQAPGLRVRR